MILTFRFIKKIHVNHIIQFIFVVHALQIMPVNFNIIN